MGETRDAKLPVFFGNARRIFAVYGNKGLEFDPAPRQGFGKLNAGARCGRIGIDRVVQNTETALVSELFVSRADILRLAQAKAALVSV
ncbi:hypothetical protein MnTg02_03031 [bacterium MnTg02]|nr:hypothetical protein MnTg02_03031 [bacterium MnTg02]